MNIQSINSNTCCQKTNQRNTSFGCIWGRFGEIKLKVLAGDPKPYHSAFMFPCLNGQKVPKDMFYKESKIEIFETCGITPDEEKSAFSFLTNKIQDSAGYAAVQKLLKFMEPMSTDGGQHMRMFLENEDLCEPANKKNMFEIVLPDINAKIHDYEVKHNLVKQEKKPAPTPMEEFTSDSLSALINNDDVVA